MNLEKMSVELMVSVPAPGLFKAQPADLFTPCPQRFDRQQEVHRRGQVGSVNIPPTLIWVRAFRITYTADTVAPHLELG